MLKRLASCQSPWLSADCQEELPSQLVSGGSFSGSQFPSIAFQPCEDLVSFHGSLLDSALAQMTKHFLKRCLIFHRVTE